jgi:hypothetical protein
MYAAIRYYQAESPRSTRCPCGWRKAKTLEAFSAKLKTRRISTR